ncbi:helix-turn-helix transcriptional regulator [Vreelandella olivaria]|uniref:helix-turn-helix transcriptional regulator n=1 Tax=Vreelandella olivaria TaxID=390919 RepID=UPI00201EAD87|nr:helix-turn-helix transcriptional regulator [Halomonas olivaria]
MLNGAVVSCLKGIRSKQPWLVLTAAQKFSVAGSNNPAISHFYSFEKSPSAQATMAIPDGCIDILFDCDASSPKAEVFGTPMVAIDIHLECQHRYFGVRFASSIIPNCLKLSAEELVEHQFSLQEVIPHTDQLFEAVVEEADFAAQVASFQQFFENKQARQLSPLTQAIVRFTGERQGNVRIDELAELTGYSTRTIQRQFRADMGMSPKAFGRIIRCQSAVYIINHRNQVTFSDMAFELGFSDQPHFLKEFKKLVSATPMSYQHCVRQQTYLDRIQSF